MKLNVITFMFCKEKKNKWVKNVPSKIVLILKSFPLNQSIKSRNVTQPAKAHASETIFKTTIAAIEKLLQIEGRIETQRKYYVRYIF